MMSDTCHRESQHLWNLEAFTMLEKRTDGQTSPQTITHRIEIHPSCNVDPSGTSPTNLG